MQFSLSMNSMVLLKPIKGNVDTHFVPIKRLGSITSVFVDEAQDNNVLPQIMAININKENLFFIKLPKNRYMYKYNKIKNRRQQNNAN